MNKRREQLLERLDRVVRQASGMSVLLSQAMADRLQMNTTDLESLDLLALHGPMTAGRLAELTGLTTGAITGVVDRLERAGIVRRVPDPDDRRRVIVEPIPRAVDRIAAYYAPMAHAMAEVNDRYSNDELALIAEYLERSFAAAQEATARLRQESSSQSRRRAGQRQVR